MDPFDVLAQYNAEVARGIMHTDDWKLAMSKLQDQWDQMRNALTNPWSGLSRGTFIEGAQRPWWRLW